MNYKSFIASLIVAITVITISPLSVFAATLSRGSTGAEVASLQTYLIKNGFTIPLIESGVATKGYFGEQTEVAVMMYQESKDLETTGSIDTSGLGISALRLGAVSTLDGVDNPYISINGYRQYDYRQTISATSSTFCSRLNPFNATSTLKNFSVNITANGLGSQNFDVSTSSTALASSTPAFVFNASTGTGQSSTVWFANGTTTNTRVVGTNNLSLSGKSDVIVGPSDYVTARIATSSAGTFASYFTGSCQGEFVKL